MMQPVPELSKDRVQVSWRSDGPRGAFGRVSLEAEVSAEDGQWTPCAVKAVPSASVDQELRYSFDHPNIIRHYGYYNDDDTTYIVMERGDRSLQSLDMKVTTTAEKRKILRDIASALVHLGHCGVLHRDLKPTNVVCVGDTWKIIDFGLARRHLRQCLMPDGIVKICDRAAGTAEFTDPVCRDPRRARLYAGLPRGLQALVDVYSLGRIMRWMFPTDPGVMSIEYDCTRDDLRLRCTAEEVLHYLDSVTVDSPVGDYVTSTLRLPPNFAASSMVGYPRCDPEEPKLQANQFRYVEWRDDAVKARNRARHHAMYTQHHRFPTLPVCAALGIEFDFSAIAHTAVLESMVSALPITPALIPSSSEAPRAVILAVGCGKTTLFRFLAREQLFPHGPTMYATLTDLRQAHFDRSAFIAAGPDTWTPTSRLWLVDDVDHLTSAERRALTDCVSSCDHVILALRDDLSLPTDWSEPTAPFTTSVITLPNWTVADVRTFLRDVVKWCISAEHPIAAFVDENLAATSACESDAATTTGLPAKVVVQSVFQCRSLVWEEERRASGFTAPSRAPQRRSPLWKLLRFNSQVHKQRYRNSRRQR